MKRPKSHDWETHFSELLSQLSTTFARIAPAYVDSEISGWLERICSILGFDRSILAEYLSEKAGFYTSYRWSRLGFPEAPGPDAPASDFLPWVCSTGASGAIVTVPNVAVLPKDASRDRSYMLDIGMKAIAGVPIMIGSRLVAGITLEDFTAERQWAPSMLAKLTIVGEIFANALERKRSAAENAKLREEAHGVSRLTLMGETAAAVAHELSHPLGAIVANAQAAKRLLQAKRLNLTEVNEALDDVIAAERRAAAYVEKVRALFRKSGFQTESLRVDTLLDEVASLTRTGLLSRDISLELMIEPGLPSVKADRVGIEQVLLNLISNAVDAVSFEKHSRRQIILRAWRRDQQWISVSVSDNGDGIDQSDLPKIFQPLFTTKAKGTGMGLAIVYTIVESHGSQVYVRSERGAGSTFEFALPVSNLLEIDIPKH